MFMNVCNLMLHGWLEERRDRRLHKFGRRSQVGLFFSHNRVQEEPGTSKVGRSCFFQLT